MIGVTISFGMMQLYLVLSYQIFRTLMDGVYVFVILGLIIISCLLLTGT
jgi:hypothetical protein